jgi:hypothetical protein
MPAANRIAKTAAISTRAPARAKRRPAGKEDARFEAWLASFDARQADLEARLDDLLRSVGVDPAGAAGRMPA